MLFMFMLSSCTSWRLVWTRLKILHHPTAHRSANNGGPVPMSCSLSFIGKTGKSGKWKIKKRIICIRIELRCIARLKMLLALFAICNSQKKHFLCQQTHICTSVTSVDEISWRTTESLNNICSGYSVILVFSADIHQRNEIDSTIFEIIYSHFKFKINLMSWPQNEWLRTWRLICTLKKS